MTSSVMSQPETLGEATSDFGKNTFRAGIFRAVICVTDCFCNLYLIG